jgi:hypothetical protein
MEKQKKEAYSEPMLIKHEPLRDITAGATTYGGQTGPLVPV